MKESTDARSGPPAHKLRPAHWRLAVQALERVLTGAPADAVLQEIFRAAPQCGSRDRANIAGLVYGVLRDACELEVIAGRDASALCGAHLLRTGTADEALLVDWGLMDAAGLVARVQAAAAPSRAQQLNVPDDAYARWLARWGEEQAARLAQALNREGPVDLRV